MIISGVLNLVNIIMANNFGINPVSGGNPANEINIIDSIN
jgi:hypothetical protein